MIRTQLHKRQCKNLKLRSYLNLNLISMLSQSHLSLLSIYKCGSNVCINIILSILKHSLYVNSWEFWESKSNKNKLIWEKRKSNSKLSTQKLSYLQKNMHNQWNNNKNLKIKLLNVK